MNSIQYCYHFNYTGSIWILHVWAYITDSIKAMRRMVKWNMKWNNCFLTYATTYFSLEQQVKAITVFSLRYLFCIKFKFNLWLILFVTLNFDKAGWTKSKHIRKRVLCWTNKHSRKFGQTFWRIGHSPNLCSSSCVT